jgi:hypothetical protein
LALPDGSRVQGLTRPLGIAFASALVALAVVVAGAGATPTRADARVAAGCGDPVVHDRYDGFHVGVPAGWSLTIANGFIVVHKDQVGSLEAVVDPALLAAGQSPAKFFTAALAVLKKSVTQAGNAMSFTLASHGGVETASITGRAGTVAVAGQATMRVIAAPTAHAARLAVFSAYWAPPAQLSGTRTALAAIGGCYGPERGALFRIFRDKAFVYALPPGWIVHEAVDELLIDDGANASANYFFSQAISASKGVTDVKSYLQFMFHLIGIKIDTVISSGSAPSKQTVSGGTQEFEQMEFLGSLGAKRIHGIVGAQSVSGGGVTSGALRLAMSTRALWNSVNPALLRVAAGIQHDFTQDDQQLLRVQQQLQGFAQQVQGFDQALNGTDIVSDPATGQTFEAPYTAYSATGPDGPGYYTGSPGNLHKLKIVTP